MARPRKRDVGKARELAAEIEAEQRRSSISQELAITRLLQRAPRRWGSRRTVYRLLALHKDSVEANRRQAERLQEIARKLDDMDRRNAEVSAKVQALMRSLENEALLKALSKRYQIDDRVAALLKRHEDRLRWSWRK